MNGRAVEIVELAKSYGAVTAIENLSLGVDPGTICGMIGPDGAGKTTTMRILCGLLRPDSGRAAVMGRDSATEAAAVKELIGYMPQRFSLYPDLTVAENMGFFADLYRVPDQERRRRDAELMEFSRLGEFRDRRAGRLSGGMKQKLALCCTLIHTPRVLVLDEPTTGVDPVSRREFWRILRELAGEGLALLVSTPYMDEADLCDDVVLVHAGRIIASGTPQQVAAAFPRRLMEIDGPDLARAAPALAAVSGVAAHRFGNRLHLVYDDAEQAAGVRTALAGLQVAAHEIEPGIEDTFVELMTIEAVTGEAGP